MLQIFQEKFQTKSGLLIWVVTVYGTYFARFYQQFLIFSKFKNSRKNENFVNGNPFPKSPIINTPKPKASWSISKVAKFSPIPSFPNLNKKCSSNRANTLGAGLLGCNRRERQQWNGLDWMMSIKVAIVEYIVIEILKSKYPVYRVNYPRNGFIDFLRYSPVLVIFHYVGNFTVYMFTEENNVHYFVSLYSINYTTTWI